MFLFKSKIFAVHEITICTYMNYTFRSPLGGTRASSSKAESGMRCKNNTKQKKSYICARFLCPVSSSLLFSGGPLVLSIIFLRLCCPLLKQARDFCSSSRASWHRKKQNRGSRSVLRLVRPQQMRQMGKSDCSKSHGSSVSSRDTNLYPPTK